jgi:hypothetical protein
MLIALLGDTHHHWADRLAIRRCVERVRRRKPGRIVQVGDLYDRRSWSRHFPSRDLESPREEATKARAHAEEMWSRLLGASPRAEGLQLLGNHDVFPLKRSWERYPEAETPIREWITREMAFPGVQTAATDRDVLELGEGWYVTHGWTSRGKHAQALGRNVVVGHTHTAGLEFQKNARVWEANVGWLGDWEAPPFWYTPARTNQWTSGIGWLDDGVFTFEAFEPVRSGFVISPVGGRNG